MDFYQRSESIFSEDVMSPLRKQSSKQTQLKSERNLVIKKKNMKNFFKANELISPKGKFLSHHNSLDIQRDKRYKNRGLQITSFLILCAEYVQKRKYKFTHFSESYLSLYIERRCLLSSDCF